MNIHEFKVNSIKSFGVTIQEGIVADTPEKAVEAAKELQKQTGTGWWVVKSQIHAGGRGKAQLQELTNMVLLLQNHWMPLKLFLLIS